MIVVGESEMITKLIDDFLKLKPEYTEEDIDSVGTNKLSDDCWRIDTKDFKYFYLNEGDNGDFEIINE